MLVLGSQSILGSFDEDDLPAPTTASREADISFLVDPDRRKADQVDAVIGEMTTFHNSNGYYAEGIHTDTATLPAGWRDRLVRWNLRSSEPAEPWFLEPHDLAVAKLVAGRDKDLRFVGALLGAGLLDAGVIGERAELVSELDSSVRERLQRWVDRS